MIKFRNLKNIILILISLLIGAGVTAMATPNNLMLSRTQSTIDRLNKSKRIWENFGGIVDSNNQSDSFPDSAWNANNTIGPHSTTLLTLTQADGKIIHRINLLKAIWEPFAGAADENNGGNSQSNTAWNVNNKIGAAVSSPYLTRSQANAKIYYQINKLKAIWENFGGTVDSNNQSNARPGTAWNANNRIGADNSTAFLTRYHADEKIIHQINLLKTIWQNFGGTINSNNQSNSRPDTPWNSNNKIGDYSTALLTPSQANAKINYQINKSKTKWKSWGGIVDSYNQSNSQPDTAWNDNNRIGRDHSSPFLTRSQANAKIIHQINSLKTIWQNFGGTINFYNRSNSQPGTAWNANNTIGPHSTTLLTPPQANAKINYRINQLKTIWENWGGRANSNNRGNSQPNTAWNANNKIGAAVSSPFLTQEQAYAKINYRINLLKTIWQNFGGTIDSNNQSNSQPGTAWNANNRTGAAVSSPLLTPNQANAKINHQINQLKTIWENWGGVVNQDNTSNDVPHAPWNANNSIGNEVDFLTISQATAKINYQRIQKLDQLRAIWENLDGKRSSTNTSNEAPNTPWNLNNRIGAEDTADFLTLNQANAKINNQIDDLKMIWESWGGVVNQTNSSNKQPNTPWNLNNRIGAEDTADFLTPFQANAKIEHQVVQKLEELKAIWIAWEGEVSETSVSNNEPTTPWNFNNRIGAEDTADFLTLSQANAKIERQSALKLNTFTVAGWSLVGTVLTSDNNDKGTFVLTFSVADGTLKYTLANTESDEADDFWSAFNSDHQVAIDANDANTSTKVETLINNAFVVARATLSELDRINALFNDNTSWVLNGTVLTGTIENRGIFSLTFTIDANDGTLKYTLANTASEEVADFWSAFNSVHLVPKDVITANTVIKVETLINTAYSDATELAKINALFTSDEDTDWKLFGSVLTTTILGKGTFSLTFTINSDGTLEYILTNTETIKKKIAFWSTFNSAHETAKNATAVSTVADVNTLINNAYNAATLKAINALFTADEDTSWELFGSVLTTTIDAKGTFSLTFTIDANDETLKYKIVQTAATEDADWTAFNTEHNVAKDASTVDTVTKVQDLINTAHIAAVETRTALENERTTINALFTADAGWVLDGAVLTSVNNAKGTFKLTFSIEDGTLKYTLSEIANADDADWSAFNSAHETASDATAVNTLANVNTLINAGHIAAVETTEKAKGSVIGIIAIIIIASIALVALMFLGYRFIKKRN